MHAVPTSSPGHLSSATRSMRSPDVQASSPRSGGSMRAPVLLVPFVLLLIAAGDPVPEGLKKFQGSWKLKSLLVDGKMIPAEALKNTTLSIKGEKYTFTNGDMKSGGIYKVDITKKPHTLDIVIMEGPDKGKTLPAIYEFKGDGLKICLSLKGKRPEKFASEPESGVVLESWMKAKE
jgi:uncharacterized protein (TIGR03067 family)